MDGSTPLAVETKLRRELLLGCGRSRAKRVTGSWGPKDWTHLTTLDMDADVLPDVVHDLDVCPYPFPSDSFDEVHAYEVLEHTGHAGDWRFFFRQMFELWRILKPDGLLVATTPMWDSPWAWGDPGHRRVFCKEMFLFLDRSEYAQLGQTSMTDYSFIWEGDFRKFTFLEEEHRFGFILQAVKPVRPYPHHDRSGEQA